MLLQIAEPEEFVSKAKCRQRVVGIDLGTTHSLVACVIDGTAVCIPDANGRLLLPSVVRYQITFPPRVDAVGYEALSSLSGVSLASVKRLMGRGLSDLSPDILREYPIDVDRSAQTIHCRVGEHPSSVVTPVEVSAEILRTLKGRAEMYLGGPIDGAVITVPAYFDEAQRQATKDAARMAGIPLIRLLSEPTAAALAYGLHGRPSGRFAVYDVGGGTFDVSVLDLQKEVFTVLATAGDTALGGDDMDRACARILLEHHSHQESLSKELETDSAQWRQWLAAARTVKHALTFQESLDWVQMGSFPGTTHISRKEFEESLTTLLHRTSIACRRAMRDAGLEPAQIDGVILVGGATRVPAVRRHVAALFEKDPICSMDPDTVVAIGAAIQAELLANVRDDVLLVDVNPLSLGIVLMGDVVEKIILRNSRIPTLAKQTFTTYADRQTGFDVHVVQGERETVSGCRSLARFTLTGLPPLAAGMARLEVTFFLDENGMLVVTAKEMLSGKQAHIEVKPSYGLTSEQVEQMLLDSYDHAEEDMKMRLLLEQRTEADRVLLSIQKAIAEDGALLQDDERTAIADRIEAVKKAALGKDAAEIAAHVRRLDEESHSFIERRVDRHLNAAVTGMSVSAIVKE